MIKICKKSIFVISITLLFSACEDWPGKASTTTEDEISANLNNGGNGNSSNPYAIGSGIFTVLDDEDYYDFDVKNSNDDCAMILYDVESNYGSYTMNSDDGTYNSNISAEIYSTYNNMSNGTYKITNNSSVDSKFGVYSTCVDSTYDYSLREFTSTNNEYDVEAKYELFSFELSSKASVSFSYSGDGYYSFYDILMFDEDFNRLTSLDDLETGRYYVLLEGSSTDTPTITFSTE